MRNHLCVSYAVLCGNSDTSYRYIVFVFARVFFVKYDLSNQQLAFT